MIKHEIIKLIQRATGEKLEKIKVECSQGASHGDYSTNIALRLRKNPEEIAKKLKSNLFEKIETARPGFINFFVSKEYLQRQIKNVLKNGDKFGKVNIGKKIKTNIEFISANPTGQLHVGNGRGAFFGDCLANVLGATGYKLTREYYINDSKSSNQVQELGKTALGKGKSYLTPYLKTLIENLKPHLKKFKSETDAGYFLAQNILSDIRRFTKEKLKIKFDLWISEQSLYRQDSVKIIYDFLKNKNLVHEKDGAFWLNLSEFSQKDEVLVRRNGQATYFLTDIAYHKDKIKRGFKKIIDIWGADHQGHVSKMKAAVKILGYRGNLDILVSQVVRLKHGKMSKRKGEIITLEDLIDEVGLDAARFMYLTKSLDTQMEFDLELAKEQSEKNPVYYIQYAYARICSILRKCKMKNAKIKNRASKRSEGKKENEIPFVCQMQNAKLLEHPSELGLIKQIIRLPEIIEEVAKDYQIQRLPQYATDLATAFHQFYRDCRVLPGRQTAKKNQDEKRLREARLALLLSAQIVLKNTLSLMGISAPEKM